MCVAVVTIFGSVRLYSSKEKKTKRTFAQLNPYETLFLAGHWFLTASITNDAFVTQLY